MSVPEKVGGVTYDHPEVRAGYIVAAEQLDRALAARLIVHLLEGNHDLAIETTNQQREIAEELGDNTAAVCYAVFAAMLVEKKVALTEAYYTETMQKVLPQWVIDTSKNPDKPGRNTPISYIKPGHEARPSRAALHTRTVGVVNDVKAAFRSMIDESEPDQVSSNLVDAISSICTLVDKPAREPKLPRTRKQMAELLSGTLELSSYFKTLPGEDITIDEILSLSRILESCRAFHTPYVSAGKVLAPIANAAIERLIEIGDEQQDINLKETAYLEAFRGYAFLTEDVEIKEAAAKAKQVMHDRLTDVNWPDIAIEMKSVEQQKEEHLADKKSGTQTFSLQRQLVNDIEDIYHHSSCGPEEQFPIQEHLDRYTDMTADNYLERFKLARWRVRVEAYLKSKASHLDSGQDFPGLRY